MSKRIHITPDGPRACSVDHNNPNSIGCRYPGTSHFTDPVAAQRAFEEMQGGSFNNAKSLLAAGRANPNYSANPELWHEPEPRNRPAGASNRLTDSQKEELAALSLWRQEVYWRADGEGLPHSDSINFAKAYMPQDVNYADVDRPEVFADTLVETELTRSLREFIHAYKSKHEEKRVSEAYSKRLEGLTPEQRNQVWKMRGSYRGDYWVAVEQGLSHDDAIAFTKTWRSTYMRDHADENYEEARSAAISKFSKD